MAEWAFLNGVEVVREPATGSGFLDFCLIGQVAGEGPVSFCIEVKRAHADDLMHGLLVQLPEYMVRRRGPYGAYLVLWFRGEWFDRPTRTQVEALWSRPGYTVPDPPQLSDFELPLPLRAPDRVRVFILDVTKPTPPSKR